MRDKLAAALEATDDSARTELLAVVWAACHAPGVKDIMRPGDELNTLDVAGCYCAEVALDWVVRDARHPLPRSCGRP